MELKPDSINLIEVCFRVLKYVVERKEFSTKDLTELIGITERNARRYVNALKEVFKDHIIKEGRKYKFKDISYDFRKYISNNDINEEILKALIKIAKKLSLDQNFYREIEKSLSKNILETELEFLLKDVLVYEKIEDIYDKLKLSIDKNYIISFKYKDRFYKVEPYKLVFNLDFWYLVAVDRKDNKLKTFAVDLIRDIKYYNDEVFIKDRKILEKIRKSKSVWQIVYNSDFKKVKVLVKSEISSYFKRKEIFLNQKILKELNDNCLLIEFEVANKYDLKDQVLKFIPYIKIIEPEEYKNYLIDILQESIFFQN